MAALARSSTTEAAACCHPSWSSGSLLAERAPHAMACHDGDSNPANYSCCFQTNSFFSQRFVVDAAELCRELLRVFMFKFVQQMKLVICSVAQLCLLFFTEKHTLLDRCFCFPKKSCLFFCISSFVGLPLSAVGLTRVVWKDAAKWRPSSSNSAYFASRSIAHITFLHWLFLLACRFRPPGQMLIAGAIGIKLFRPVPTGFKELNMPMLTVGFGCRSVCTHALCWCFFPLLHPECLSSLFEAIAPVAGIVSTPTTTPHTCCRNDCRLPWKLRRAYHPRQDLINSNSCNCNLILTTVTITVM